MKTLVPWMLAAALSVAWAGSATAKTQLKVSEMTVDGLTVMHVHCTLTGGGFLAGATLIGSLAKQKKKIHACGPKGQAARLTYQLAGKGPKGIKVLSGSTKKVGPCQAKALAKVRTKLKGTCAMTILSGPKAAAKKAAKTLATKR